MVIFHCYVNVYQRVTNQEPIFCSWTAGSAGLWGRRRVESRHQSPLCGRFLRGAECGFLQCREGLQDGSGPRMVSWDLIKHDLGIPHFHKVWPKVLGRPHTIDFIPNLKWQDMLDLHGYEPKLRTQCKPIPLISNVTPIPKWRKIADLMQSNSMDTQYPMLHPYPNGIETYWEHTATG